MKTKTYIFSLIFLFAFVSVAHSSTAWLFGYKQRKLITIDADTHLTSDLTGPGKYNSDSGEADFWDSSPPVTDGCEVRFTTVDGTTLIPFDNESYNATEDDAHWSFEIDYEGTTGDTFAYINWDAVTPTDGCTTNTWDANYIGAYYQNTDNPNATGSREDQTSNSNNGTENGSLPTDVAGQVDRGQTFDGTGDQFEISDIEMSAYTDLTVDGWFKTSDSANSQRVWSKDQIGAAGNFLLWFDQPVNSWKFQAYDDGAAGFAVATYASTAENDGAWHHIAGVVDNTNDLVRLYMDGVQKATAAFTDANLSDGDNEILVIGADSDTTTPDHEFIGDLDDLTISDNARSADWVIARYRSGLGATPDVGWLTVGATQANPLYMSSSISFAVSLTATTLYSPGLISRPSDEGALGQPFQNHVWNDGRYITAIWDEDGTSATQPQIIYGENDTLQFHTAHNVPSMTTVTGGRGLSMYYPSAQYSWGYSMVGQAESGDREMEVTAKDNDTDSTSYNIATHSKVPPATFASEPTVILARNDTAWMSSTNGTTGLEVASKAVGNVAFSAATTIHTLSGDSGAIQLIPYNAQWTGKIGACYAYGSSAPYTLKYKEYSGSSWGSAETIATDLGHYKKFRCVASRNDRIVATWREYHATDSDTLRGNVRDGTWDGAADVVDADLVGTANNLSGFTSMANMGEDDEVYIAFVNNANTAIEQIIWTEAGGFGAASSIVTVATKSTYRLSSPLWDSDMFTVIYHKDSTNQLMIHTEDMGDPTELGSEGILISREGNRNQAFGQNYSTHVRTYNNHSFFALFNRGNEIIMNVYDNSSETWDFAEWGLGSPYRYSDLHNSMDVYLDTSGFAYLIMGGRTMSDGDDENIRIYKSDYAIDDASFSNVLSIGWTNISPPAITGRGYKRIVVDDDGDLFLFYMVGYYGGSNGIFVMERSAAGTWYTAVRFAMASDTSGDSKTYMQGISLGDEVSGQKSIHFLWGIRDDSGTNVYHETYYTNIMPQVTHGTFKFYRSDLTEHSAGGLPIDESDADLVYSMKDNSGTDWPCTTWTSTTAYGAYDCALASPHDGFMYTADSGGGTTSGSQPTWPTNQWGTVVDNDITWTKRGIHSDSEAGMQANNAINVQNNTEPIIAIGVSGSGSYFIVRDGTNANWVEDLVSSTVIAPNALLVGSEGLFLILSNCNIQSIDDGATWSSCTSWTADTPWFVLTSDRDSLSKNLIYMEKGSTDERNPAYSEIRWSFVTISSGQPMMIRFRNVPFTFDNQPFWGR